MNIGNMNNENYILRFIDERLKVHIDEIHQVKIPNIQKEFEADLSRIMEILKQEGRLLNYTVSKHKWQSGLIVDLSITFKGNELKHYIFTAEREDDGNY